LQQALKNASMTIKNIDSISIKHIKAHLQDNRITSYGLNCKISFRIDNEERKNGL
ncbi:MAG: dodecin domain-containing protein, partial [Chitinophagaceae bacterium]|nr:dodecin domain-containing protein [Chitinophagaceae bacterium]